MTVTTSKLYETPKSEELLILLLHLDAAQSFMVIL